MTNSTTSLRPAYAPEPTDPVALTEKWMPLAIRCSRGWNIPGMDAEDLAQEARLVIFKCAQRYDPSKGSFFSLAKWAIRNKLCSLYSKTQAIKRRADLVSMEDQGREDAYDIHELVPDRRQTVGTIHLDLLMREHAEAVGMPLELLAA